MLSVFQPELTNETAAKTTIQGQPKQNKINQWPDHSPKKHSHPEPYPDQNVGLAQFYREIDQHVQRGVGQLLQRASKFNLFLNQFIFRSILISTIKFSKIYCGGRIV